MTRIFLFLLGNELVEYDIAHILDEDVVGTDKIKFAKVDVIH